MQEPSADMPSLEEWEVTCKDENASEATLFVTLDYFHVFYCQLVQQTSPLFYNYTSIELMTQVLSL